MSNMSMGDAAFSSGLNGTSFDIAGGYLDSVNALNPWTPADWDKFKGYKFPFWVAPFGPKNGTLDAREIKAQLIKLKVPPGSYLGIDMEGSKDVTYLEAVYAELHRIFKILVYGSADTVFGNPPLNGYLVADYAGIGPFMYNHSHVRGTQYESGDSYDSSVIKRWVGLQFWK